MNWNNHKFQQIRLGNNHNLKEDTLYFSPEMTNVIEVKEYVKDLGILVDDKVKYNHHLQKAIAKTRQKIGWITQTFKNRSVNLMRILWNSLVQSHMDTSY